MAPYARFFEVLWLTAGELIQVIDYHQTVIEPNSLFFVSPGQLHLMGSKEALKGYSMAFTEEFLLQQSNHKDLLLQFSFLNTSYANPALYLNQEDVDELQPVISIIEGELARPEKSSAIIGKMLLVFLQKIQRMVTRQHPAVTTLAGVEKLKRFKTLIEQHYKTQKALPFYAQRLHLSTHRLNQICTQIAHRTAGSLLRDRVLQEAKRLLVHTDLTIGQIADELGFADLAYFSRHFRQAEGLPPALYRKMMSEKYQTLG